MKRRLRAAVTLAAALAATASQGQSSSPAPRTPPPTAGGLAVDPAPSTPSTVPAPGEIAPSPKAAQVIPGTGIGPGMAPGMLPTAPSALPENKIAFEYKIPVEKGGGSVSGTAGAVETSGESDVTLSEGIEIKYRNLVFRADRAVLHRDTMTVEAEGDVVIDQGTRRIAAQRTDFDLATETGTFWNAAAFAEPDQYFTGAVVVKTGDETFEIQDGVFTACTGDQNPDWSFRIADADVELGGYAHLKHARMRVKKMPVLYVPYMIWPAKTERSSGFLIPNIGYTRTRGVLLGLAYYQVMGPSADLTLHFDAYEKRYLGAGAEFRYAPWEGTTGDAFYQVLQDRDASLTETRAVWRHTTERLPGGLRLVVDVNQYSNYDFFREFQRGEKENTRSFLYSNAFLSGNWGAQSLSAIVDNRETFRADGETSTQRQLPEVAYRLRKLKLGRMPLYFSVDSTASYFFSENPGLFDVDYGRFDLSPELTLPLRIAPWISIALSAGGRGTWWGESVPRTEIDPLTGLPIKVCDSGPVPAEQQYCGEDLTRAVPRGEAEIVGPSFSRIFESPGGRFEKFKHVVEPRFSYGYAQEFDEENRIARFDEVDGASDTNSGRAAIVNRILAKPSNPEEGGAFEIFAFELSQRYAFDDRILQRSRDGLLTSKEGPLESRLRYSPSRNLDVQAKATWSTLFNELDSTSLSVRGKSRRVGVDLTWYSNYDVETGEQTSDQARVGLDLGIWPERLILNSQVNYDLQKSELLQHRHLLTYRSQCWSVILEFREQITSLYETQDFRFLLTLKNVGTFLDLHGGESTDGY